MKTRIPPPRELVLASAGAGKTFRISSRLIGLLAYGEEPDRILAATFTRKAAGQILDRVLERLAAATLDAEKARDLAVHARFDGAPPIGGGSGEWGEVLERVVERLHRLSVGTLDAFFIRAAGAFASEIGLPPDWSIPDLPAAQRLRSQALLQLSAQLDRARMSELLRLSARGDSKRSVHEHLGRMMDQLLQIQEQLDPHATDPWSAFLAAPPQQPEAEDPEQLAAALEALPVPCSANGMRKQNWANNLTRAADALRLRDWEALVGLTLCQKVASGEDTFDRAAIEPAVREVIERVLNTARAELRPRLGRQVQALGELTAAFEARYRELQRAAGLYTFSDITRKIAEGEPLGTRADLYYRLDAQTRHALLDEFQDTSLAQWNVLAPIIDEVLSDDSRAGVIVADPKQSIYAWRGAEPDLVHKVERHYGLERSNLAKSYRSSRIVLDFVNRVFGEIDRNPVLQDGGVCQDIAERWKQDFVRHEPAKELPGYVALEVGPGDEGRSSRRPRLYRHVAEKVAGLHKSCPGFTIGVLTRTNAVAGQIYLELRKCEVEVSQEGGTPLTDAPVCEAVLALLRLADHPADSIARYHVAYSPLGPLVELTDHSDRAAADRAARRLRRELLADGYGDTLTRLARRCVPHCDARDARRLFQLVEMAHSYDAGSTLRPSDFVRLVEAERVEDRTTAAVRVMTIHQAKGLEFDIVVLPQLDDSFFKGGRSAPASVYRADPGGGITAVFPQAGKELHCLFPELEVAHKQQRAAVVRDGLSTLYVALTRAKYASFAVICPDGESGEGKAVTPSRILRAALADGVEGVTPAVTGEVLFEMGDPDWYRDPRAEGEGDAGSSEVTVTLPQLRLSEGSRSLRRRSPSDLHDDELRIRDLLRIDNAGALDRGSIVHAWFERIGWLEDGVPSDNELSQVARQVAPGLAASTLQEMLAEFRSWLEHPGIRRLLQRTRYGGSELLLERELPFIRRAGDSLMEGVIDRVVLRRSANGFEAAEIIDYKTDRVPRDELRVTAFAERYRAQLSAYADAVSELYGVPRARCTGTLLLLEHQRAIDVPLQAKVVQTILDLGAPDVV